jgi:4-aminobutyrate aminotransferase-like enzyme
MSDAGALNCAAVLGPEAVRAMSRAQRFLQRRDTKEMLALVGGKLERLALHAPSADKRFFPASYGGGKSSGDDLLAARGVFYVTEEGRVMLDCTSGHYQMTWGYNHPELSAATAEAMKLGIVWDNHSNIPSLPVKQLSQRLVSLMDGTGLDRVLLGVCTGSIACGAALKIMLLRYSADRARAKLGPPVMIALAGNYHGTDIAAQTMRGMWPGLLAGMETIQVEPNDEEALRGAFRRCEKRVAGFWAEPIMMNREVIALEPGFLKLARELCTEHGALMAIDEIQTGFWYPEVLLTRRLGIAPDMVVVGKGMTAGFHPLAGLLYRRELDILQQYDVISTNGNASLPAFVALCNLRLIERQRRSLDRLSRRHFDGLRKLAAEFPGLVEQVNGAGYLTGLKFRDRADALGFHKSALAGYGCARTPITPAIAPSS